MLNVRSLQMTFVVQHRIRAAPAAPVGRRARSRVAKCPGGHVIVAGSFAVSGVLF